MNTIVQALANSGFGWLDLGILVVYLIILVGLGFFFSRSKDGKEKSANDYFLAGNTLTWWAVGASLIAANISAEQFIGMSGTGYADGIATMAYEIMAAVTLLIIGKFLLPIMIRKHIFTIPQFLSDRYNGGVGLAFSILWLFLYVFVNLTSVAWLGALAIEQILGLQGLVIDICGITISMRMLIIICLFAIAGLYSIYGGLASVAWTDVMQVTFLVGGGLITAFVALHEIGQVFDTNAFGAISRIYTDLTTGDYATDSHFHLIVRQSSNPAAFANVPGIAAVVGALWISNLGYWGFNQYIIQKGLAAKSLEEAQKGLVFAGFLKIIIPFIVVMPGICAYYIVRHPDAFASLGLQGTINIPDDAYPWLIRNFTPVGIKGLSFAALVAAIISSLASMLNSTSTLFTMDIYKKYINKTATDRNLVRTGRIVSVCALIIALFTVKPLLGEIPQAFQYIQEYSGFIFPGIVVVFGLGLLWKRASSRAAIWTAIITIPLGVLFKVLAGDVPFLFRAGYVFIILVIFFILLSYLDNRFVEAEMPDERDCRTMLRYAKILGFSGLTFLLLGIVVTAMGDVTPITAYLNDIGFQAFIFFGVLVGCNGVWLYSNATDHRKDANALEVDLSVFHTSRSYAYGALAIGVITILIYVLLW